MNSRHTRLLGIRQQFSSEKENANEESNREKRVAWRRYWPVREPWRPVGGRAIIRDSAARAGDRRARPPNWDRRARQANTEADGEDHQTVSHATWLAQCDRHRP